VAVRRILFVVTVLVLATAAPALAEAPEDTGFGLRFTSALSRFSRYPDLAGLGGAGGGSPWSSSPNPASSGMNPAVGPSRFGASAQYALATFQEGTDVHVGAVSASWDACTWGVWQPSFLAVRSNRAETSDGLTFGWEAVGAELQWATKLAPWTSVGVNLSVLDSETQFDLGPAAVSDSTSTTYAARFGILHKLSGCFVAGVSTELSVAPSTTLLHDVLGLGTGDVRVDDHTRGLVVRPGLYTFLTKDLTLYAEYVFSRFADDTGALVNHRAAAGLDLTVIQGLYVRAGAVVDRWGNLSGTLGLGVAPSESVMIDLSWQVNMFPEIEPEFGRGDTFGLGLTVLF
jgi:hypothetical protein